MACGGPPPPTASTPARTAWFEDVAKPAGIDFLHRAGHEGSVYRLPEIMGGGAALFDMDGDGDLDALLVQSGVLGAADRGPRHQLYRNDGGGHFTNVTAGSGVDVPGYGMGVAAGDYDGDGDVDLYLTNYGANVLLQNDGRGRFTDVTARAGVAGSGWSTSATFVDVDGDGRLDLFVTRYIDWTPAREKQCFSLTGVVDYCSPKNYDAPSTALLFHNRGDGTFADITSASGIATARGNARAQRTALTREMWESLNEAWLHFSSIRPASMTSNALPEFLDWVRSRSALYRGALLNTILRNDTYYFSQLGTFIERADSTARILDVKYYHLLPSRELIGTGADNVQWSSILRSVSAHRSYRWVYKDTYRPWNIAEYLVLNRQMPRSLRGCYDELCGSLGELATFYGLQHNCHITAKGTRELLLNSKIEDIFQSGLHEFVQAFISRNNQLGAEISSAYHFND